MALPIEQTIEVTRGTDNSLLFTIKDASGTAIDITADTVTFTARDGYAGPVRIAKKTNTTGQHTTPASGTTTFNVLRTEIDDEVAAGASATWKYEVRRITAVTLKQFVHYQGDLIIHPAVTEGP